MIRHAAIYVRVSSKDQAIEGFSIPEQLDQLKEYALKHDMIINPENIFIEPGVSARTDARPAFQQLIATAKIDPLPFEVILVHNFDRFARNRKDSLIYKDLLRRDRGLELISITEPFINATPEGQLMEGQMEVYAEYFSARLGREVMKGMRGGAKKGIALGVPPYGYTIDPETGRYAIFEPEAAVMRWVFEQYAFTSKGLREIGYEVNTKGLQMFGDCVHWKTSKAAKHTKGKPQRVSWEASAVRRRIKNPMYTGDYYWNRRKTGHRNDTDADFKDEKEWFVLQNSHTPIVDRDIFELANQKLLANQRKRSNKSEDYLLFGLVYCYECGGTMSQLNRTVQLASGETAKYRKLRCSKNARAKSCYTNSFKMSQVEDELFAYLRRILDHQIHINDLDIRITNRDVYENQYQLYQRKLASFDSQFGRQMDAYQAGIIDLVQLKYFKDKLEQEKEETVLIIQEIKNKMDNMSIETGKMYENIKNVLQTLEDSTLNTQQRRNALSQIIDRIELSEKLNLMKIYFKATI